MTVAQWPPHLTTEEAVPSMFGQDNADQVTMVVVVKRPGVVTSVQIIPSWTIAGTNTNFRTLSLINRGGGGAGTTTVATLALTSGTDLTKFVPKTLTLQAGALALARGDLLEWVTTATGTGAADVGGRVVVQQTFNP